MNWVLHLVMSSGGTLAFAVPTAID